MWFYTNTWIVLLIKLQAPTLPTLLTYVNLYIITNILRLFISCKLLKIGSSREIWTCATWAKPFLPNTHPHSWFICLLLLSLKMSTTISDWGFIWKYKRYTSKSQNDTITIQTNLKTLTWGEWPSGLRHYKWIGRLLVQTPLGALPGLGNQPYNDAPLPAGRNLNKRSDYHWVNDTLPSIMAQS